MSFVSGRPATELDLVSWRPDAEQNLVLWWLAVEQNLAVIDLVTRSSSEQSLESGRPGVESLLSWGPVMLNLELRLSCV